MGHLGEIEAEEPEVERRDIRDLLGAENRRKRVRRFFYDIDDRILHPVIRCHKAHAEGAVRVLHRLRDQVRRDAQNVLQRAVHHLDDAEEDQHVQDHRPAAGRHGHARLFLQLHQLFLLALLIVGPFLLDLLDHRVIGGHAGRALLLLYAEREHQDLCQQRKDDQRPAIVRDQPVDPFHDNAENGCEEA